MVQKALTHYRDYRSANVARLVAPYLHKGEKVLDFGADDMRVAQLVMNAAQVDLVGADIGPTNTTDLPYVQYDGKTLPFPDKSFDVTYAAFVLHHINDQMGTLKELVRVTKKRIILLEDIFDTRWEKWLHYGCDQGNRLLEPTMPLPLNFRSTKQWREMLFDVGVTSVTFSLIKPQWWKFTKHARIVVEL